MVSKHQKGLWQALDWLTILLYFLLIFSGWLTICGATYSFDATELVSVGSRPMMQLVWIGLGLIIAFAVLMISPRMWYDGAPIYYLAMLGLLFVTIFLAPNIKGSHSWLVIGPLRLQPAEFAKVTVALMLSWQCSRYGFEIKSLKSYMQVIGIILIPVALILAQSETGSALVFFSLFLALYREGFTGIFMGLSISAVVYFVGALMLDGLIFGEQTSADVWLLSNIIIFFTLIFLGIYGGSQQRLPLYQIILAWIGAQLLLGFVGHFIYPFDLSRGVLAILVMLVIYLIYLWLRGYMSRYLLIALFALGSLGFFFSTSYVFDNILEPHQQVRIKVSLGIENDLRDKGYNVDQSKIAIGSGGLWGKGFLEGTQTKLSYVPEQDTDFIFCTVGEEQGFVGSTILLLIYGVFILRIVSLAERQTTTFGRVYGYCVASIFLFHLFINVGMALGLIPVIGIPLPFFSYGGSSLWGFTFLLFILLGIDARKYNKYL
ncbi:MAG: rod shape-determining protein RodA [Porphyromonadaceae bacterium]|nr:rod shape-determining protein RodA [Porphyromonadaceae bacterium]